MSIDTQLFLLSGGLVVGSLIAAWQAFRLRAIYRSRSSWVGAITFLLLGGQRVYNFTRLSANIEKSRAIIKEAIAKGVNLRGVSLDSLTWEQWLGIVWSYAIIAGFILWMHWQHRDLEKLGL